ncbi:MAG: FAD-dependent monooxygenase [Tabrizicola sp.]|nr:FAD-dependent monooxygenase [Tabrizicola sp.]
MTADITTDVLIIGTGPAGSSCAALLSTYGIANMVVNRYHWLANSPRAHITNQRTMEVLRDLGAEVEEEAYTQATPKELMGTNVFCTSLAGEELGRLRTWGTEPESLAAHLRASPSRTNDLPQTYMEPLLFKTACSRGTQARMSTEYLRHVQDGTGVTATCLDRLTGKEVTIRSRYLVGADGGNSKVAEDIGVPIEGKMGVGGSINFLFDADLSRYVAHRPSVLYWVMQPGANVGGIGMGVVRMVRPWTKWLAIWGYDINQPRPELTNDEAVKIIRSLVGEPELKVDVTAVSYWTVNDAWATHLQKDRVFIMGDAAHRHPPSNGLGSNTSIQDAFNLAWKLAHVLRGQAGPGLLDSYSQERAPIAKEIVRRANQSMSEFGPIFGALGMGTEVSQSALDANLDHLASPDGEPMRVALREAIANKRYEFDAHGIEMNQRYTSAAVLADGTRPDFARDPVLHYQATTFPGARLPHVWLEDAAGRLVSSLDICGHGRFTLLTGVSGAPWAEAATQVAQGLSLDLQVELIGPRQTYRDPSGDWARAREIKDDGAMLVRPDHHVAWRSAGMTASPHDDLRATLAALLGRDVA